MPALRVNLFFVILAAPVAAVTLLRRSSEKVKRDSEDIEPDNDNSTFATGTKMKTEAEQARGAIAAAEQEESKNLKLATETAQKVASKKVATDAKLERAIAAYDELLQITTVALDEADKTDAIEIEANLAVSRVHEMTQKVVQDVLNKIGPMLEAEVLKTVANEFVTPIQ